MLYVFIAIMTGIPQLIPGLKIGDQIADLSEAMDGSVFA